MSKELNKNNQIRHDFNALEVKEKIKEIEKAIKFHQTAGNFHLYQLEELNQLLTKYQKQCEEDVNSVKELELVTNEDQDEKSFTKSQEVVSDSNQLTIVDQISETEE